MFKLKRKEKTRREEASELYNVYAPSVYRRIRRFFPHDEAEEILQDIFLQAIEKLDTFREESSPSTWLYRLTTNYCLNRIRNRSRRKELFEQHAPILRMAQKKKSDQETKTLIYEIWELLPRELLIIGIYHHVDGMTHGEIARVLGVSRRTVGNRLKELEQAAQNLKARKGQSKQR